MSRVRALLVVGVLCVVSSCVGTTGGEVIGFRAAASGPADVVPGMPLAFDGGQDLAWKVVLSVARIHVGAVYLNQSLPVSGAQNTSCILPGTYVAQVTTGRDVDLLSPDPQFFPKDGEGTTTPPAIVGQVWLTGGPINRVEDTTTILEIEGSAQRRDTTRPFRGKITIGSNRSLGDGETTQAGASAICKQRIVSPIPTSVSLERSGYLLLRIDPRQLFLNVDFETLPPTEDSFAFTDESTPKDQASRNLYLALHSAGSLYTFTWVP